MKFLRVLFGGPRSREGAVKAESVVTDVTPKSRPNKNRSTTAYYETMSKMQGLISNRDFGAAARLVRQNLTQIPPWVKETSEEFGSFDIGSIPALEQGGRVLALVGDNDGLTEMERIVSNSPQLERWVELVRQHQKDADLFVSILKAVEASPGCLQTDVKGLIGEADGQNVATLLWYLEKAGKLARVKSGRTYKLLPVGSPEIPPPLPKRPASSHRQDKCPPQLHELDVSRLAYIPLPRSPLRWEESRADSEQAKLAEAVEPFEVRDASWLITLVEKIPPTERPDPAFRQTYATGTGITLVDDLGKAGGLGQIPAAALCYDREGNQSAKAGLSRDVYRLAAHPLGCGMIAMSRDCILHSYDDHLNLVIDTDLTTAPEIVAIRKRFGIQDADLKNHIRCVALAADARRYLFTVVDEAWCISADGHGRWGAKLPIKDGWKRVATPSGGYGTSVEVKRALALMGLNLPITPEGLKERYRMLAKQWHPDLNRGDPDATEKMKALTAAAEVLTGIDGSELARYAGATFIREMDRHVFEAAGLRFSATISMQVSEIHAADWIYAASFAAKSNAVYLAGYSGRIIVVNENGMGERVYDIGAVPRQIIDTGIYLYILTDTRLYVLKGDELHALIDTYDRGELFVTKNGFGLLEKKRLSWHGSDGKYIGSVVSKDPIRRVYCARGHLTVETRQQRAIVEGAPDWWSEIEASIDKS